MNCNSSELSRLVKKKKKKTFIPWLCTPGDTLQFVSDVLAFGDWKRHAVRRHSAHAAHVGQRGRQLWTTSQSPVLAWSSIQGEAWPGSLPFPVCAADACCRIMGGITSSPAVLIHRSSQTNTQRYHRPGLLPAAGPALEPPELQEIQVFLPTATVQ